MKFTDEKGNKVPRWKENSYRRQYLLEFVKYGESRESVIDYIYNIYNHTTRARSGSCLSTLITRGILYDLDGVIYSQEQNKIDVAKALLKWR